MLGNMPTVPIPRMPKRWKVAAVIMAVFGFAIGYSAAAGGPFCGSVGQCLGLAARRGLAGFTPAALESGAIVAVVFAAVVFLLFLFFYGVRKAHRRPPRSPRGSGATYRAH